MRLDPFEARGFSLDYGEQDVKLNGEVSQANYEIREEAEYRKGQSGNIYSFELVFERETERRRDQQTEVDLSR